MFGGNCNCDANHTTQWYEEEREGLWTPAKIRENETQYVYVIILSLKWLLNQNKNHVKPEKVGKVSKKLTHTNWTM